MTKSRGLVSAIGILFISIVPVLAGAATNLIQNPSLDNASVANVNVPANFSVGGFGATFEGAYPVAGPGTDTKAVKMTITAYTGGDAKWVPDLVPVQAGAFYTFSDAYNTNVPSTIVAAYTHTNSTQTFEVLGNSLPSTGDTWQTVSRTLTVPADVTSMSVYHVIQSVGSITTDNYSLELTQDAAHNLFPQGIVSISFDDGWNSQYTNAFPVMQANGVKGTFYIISNPMLASAHDFFADAAATADMVTTPDVNGGKTWATIYTDPSSLQYFFSDTYTSASPSTITVSYKIASVVSSVTKNIPAGTNATADIDVTFPAAIEIGSLTISHTVAAGTITITNPSMMAIFDGYMSPTQVKLIQAAGNEIGVHTKDHCSVALLALNSADIASCALPPVGATSISDQILGAQSTILTKVNAPVNTFAYPYGQFNATAQSFLSTNGFLGARATTPGYNTLNSDHYALMVQTIDNTTTAATIKGWIDYAVNNKLWLILLFHQIDDPAAIASNGETGGTTPTIFTEVVQYLATKPTGTVLTVHDALALTAPVADTVPPVISAQSNISVATTSSAGEFVTYSLPTAQDAVDGAVTVTCLPVSGSLFILGTTTVSCSAHDVANNTSNSSFDVGVSLITTSTDTVAPVITLTGAATINMTVGDTYVEAGATATDNIDASVTVTVGGDVVNTTAAGTYTVFYNAVDTAGNHATQVVRTAIVANPAPAVSGGGGGGGGSNPIVVGGNGPIAGSYGVVNGSGTVLGASTSTLPTSMPHYTFTKNFGIRSRGADVTALQQILIALGYLKIDAPTGYFGSLTKAAVQAFQAAHTISTTGYVGPLTRGALNAL